MGSGRAPPVFQPPPPPPNTHTHTQVVLVPGQLPGSPAGVGSQGPPPGFRVPFALCLYSIPGLPARLRNTHLHCPPSLPNPSTRPPCAPAVQYEAFTYENGHLSFVEQKEGE